MVILNILMKKYFKKLKNFKVNICQFGTSMSSYRILELAYGLKGSAVRQLKRYMRWVQNVVKQFGPYLQQKKKKFPSTRGTVKLKHLV